MKAKLAWGLSLAAFLVLLAFWASRADAILALARHWAVDWKAVVQADPLPFWLGFLAGGALALNSPVPLAALVKVLSGFFFGLAGGFALNVGMSVSAGLAGFMAARHFFHHALYSRYSRQLAAINLDIARNGFWYILSTRLFVALPFFLVNALAGLSCIRKRKFLLGTALGVVPSSFLYAEAGRQLGDLTSLSRVASPRAMAVLALLAALCVAHALHKRRKGAKP